jgi:hypothetical protein
MSNIKTLSDFLDASNDGRYISYDDVPSRVQNAKIWQAIVSFPGCLGDNFTIARNREHCLSSIQYWLDEENEFSARYVRGQLRRNGICYLRDGRVITLERISVYEIL